MEAFDENAAKEAVDENAAKKACTETTLALSRSEPMPRPMPEPTSETPPAPMPGTSIVPAGDVYDILTPQQIEQKGYKVVVLNERFLPLPIQMSLFKFAQLEMMSQLISMPRDWGSCSTEACQLRVWDAWKSWNEFTCHLSGVICGHHLRGMGRTFLLVYRLNPKT